MSYNEGYRYGIRDELDKAPILDRLAEYSIDFFMGYDAGRKYIKMLRSTVEEAIDEALNDTLE